MVIISSTSKYDGQYTVCEVIHTDNNIHTDKNKILINHSIYAAFTLSTSQFSLPCSLPRQLLNISIFQRDNRQSHSNLLKSN